jgi:hypothetical protein
MKEELAAAALVSAALITGSGHAEAAGVSGFYTVECVGADGQVKWSDTIDNLVTTAGKNALLDTYLAAGTGITPALGLIDLTSYSAVAAADTMASHAGWLESTAYSNANRPAPSFGAASAGSKAASATAFNINATATIKGCFLTSQNTKGGTTGTLYSAGLFSGGDKAVGNGDTLNVTYTATIT